MAHQEPIPWTWLAGVPALSYGLFGPDDQELSYPGYARAVTPVPPRIRVRGRSALEIYHDKITFAPYSGMSPCTISTLGIWLASDPVLWLGVPLQYLSTVYDRYTMALGGDTGRAAVTALHSTSFSVVDRLLAALAPVSAPTPAWHILSGDA